MFVKIACAVLLIGFFHIQLVSSLNCFYCDSPYSCRSPSSVSCDYNHANTSNAHLHTYFKENLTSLASNNFECFHHNYTSVSLNVTYKGCVYRSVQPCSLNLKDQYTGLRRVACDKCGGNLCNPAGTFSSSLMTIITSIAALLIYKIIKS